jgi:hypothetical protein
MLSLGTQARKRASVLPQAAQPSLSRSPEAAEPASPVLRGDDSFPSTACTPFLTLGLRGTRSALRVVALPRAFTHSCTCPPVPYEGKAALR